MSGCSLSTERHANLFFFQSVIDNAFRAILGGNKMRLRESHAQCMSVGMSVTVNMREREELQRSKEATPC